MRNEKFFFLFLLIGTIACSLLVILSVIHFLYSIQYNDFEVISCMYSNNSTSLILSLSLIIFFIFFKSIGFILIKTTYTIGLIGIVSFNYLFYLNNTTNIKYINSFSLFILLSSVPCGGIVITYLLKHINLITYELTMKQYHFLLKEKFNTYNEVSTKSEVKEKEAGELIFDEDNNKDKEISVNISSENGNNIKTKRQKMKTILKFLLKPRPKSLF